MIEFIDKTKKLLPGIILVFLLVVFAEFLGKYLKVIGAESLAMILGLIVASFHFTDNKRLASGIAWSEKWPIEIGIAVLGFTVGFGTIEQVGIMGLLYILILMSSVITIGVLIAKLFKLDKNSQILLASGLAVCGSSAIAAISKVISSDDNKRRATSAVVSLTGVITLLILPFADRAIFGNSLEGGALTGGVLPSIGQAVSGSIEVGSTAGAFGILFKMMRVMMLPVVAIFFSFLVNNKSDSSDDVKISILPWFLITFVIGVVINSLGILPKNIIEILKLVGVFLSITNLAAIGLNIKITQLKSSGKLAFATIASIFVQILISFVLIKFLL